MRRRPPIARPADYRWSSAPNHPLCERDELLHDHSGYLALGRDDHERRAEYAAFCRVDLDDEDMAAIRKSADTGQVLGGERFAAEIGAALGVRLGPAQRRRPKHGSGGFAGEQGKLEL